MEKECWTQEHKRKLWEKIEKFVEEHSNNQTKRDMRIGSWAQFENDGRLPS
jgi:hypothetical protein